MAEYQSSNQDRILAYIKHEIETKGYPPSVREICNAVGLSSTSTVHGHLQRLEKKGLIRRNPDKPRALEILGDPRFEAHAHPIPVVGQVNAGQPVYAEETTEEYLMVPEFMLPGDEHFMLRVHGESMIEAGILDGDLIVVQKQRNAKNGDIVVALVEDSATVKTFYKENGHYRLQPENHALEPIIVDDVVILGKVVSLMRTLR